MTATDKAFTGSIPELYDRHLVPMIFEAYARDVAARIAGLAPAAVLETAAGTGVVTRALDAALPATVRLVATDLNDAMLAVARDRARGGSAIEWRQADALDLPFPDGDFDVVVCQFGAMFFPDKVRGFREARRVLKPGGRLVLAIWDAIAANAFADVVTRALAEFFPDDPPRFLARTPHGYGDPARIVADLTEAGFAGVECDVVEHVSRCATPREAALAFCQGTPLRAEITARDATRLEEATRRAADALANRFGPGPIEGPMRALVVTAMR